MRYFYPITGKDIGIRIRVEKELREAFQEACVAENRGASEMLRAFMQAFVDQGHCGWQPDMLPVQASRRPRQPTQKRAI